MSNKKADYNALQQLMVYGYLRSMNIIDDKFNYKDILTLIVLYCLQGYAHFYDLTDLQKSNPHETTLQFGDVIRRFKEYQIVNKNGEFINIGTYTIRYRKRSARRHIRLTNAKRCLRSISIKLNIPFEICKHLNNAHDFFRKLEEYDEFKSDIESYSQQMIIKHDDIYIINRFGSSLNAKYHSITLILMIDIKKKQELLNINYDGKYIHSFKLSQFDYSSDDFDSFYEIRKDPKNLVKIDVESFEYRSWSIQNGYCKLYSAQWEGSIGNKIFSHRYIGPKTEKEEMTVRVKEFYQNAIIKVADLEAKDWCMNWEYIEARNEKMRRLKRQLE
eukprot:346904_1